MENCKAPVEGIIGAYSGNNFVIQATIASIFGCAMYSALELIIVIFETFQVYRGLYFWSLLVSASLGVIPYAFGLVLKYFEIGPIWIPVTLSTLGWCTMVTGQSLVLYSRLDLVVLNPTVLHFVLGMIITDAVILQIPQTIASFGAVFACHRHFPRFFNTWEKVQLTTFFVQEVTISGIFIVQAIKLLRVYPAPGQRRTNIMYQLLAINLLIIAMDITLLVLEFLGKFIMQTVLKCFFYTVKLKLEIVVLSRLASFVRSQVDQESSGLS